MGIETPIKVLSLSFFNLNPMARPADRVEGVRLITDYGAGEWLLSILKSKRGEKVKVEATAPVVEEEAPVVEEEAPVMEEEAPAEPVEEEETSW